jgi:hypothetical protein
MPNFKADIARLDIAIEWHPNHQQGRYQIAARWVGRAPSTSARSWRAFGPLEVNEALLDEIDATVRAALERLLLVPAVHEGGE